MKSTRRARRATLPEGPVGRGVGTARPRIEPRSNWRSLVRHIRECPRQGGARERDFAEEVSRVQAQAHDLDVARRLRRRAGPERGEPARRSAECGCTTGRSPSRSGESLHGMEGGEVNASTPRRRGGAGEHRRHDHGAQHVRRPSGPVGSRRPLERLVGEGAAVPPPRVRAHPPRSRAARARRRNNLQLRDRRNRLRARTGAGGRRRQGRRARGRRARRAAVPGGRSRRRDGDQPRADRCSDAASVCSSASETGPRGSSCCAWFQQWASRICDIELDDGAVVRPASARARPQHRSNFLQVAGRTVVAAWPSDPAADLTWVMMESSTATRGSSPRRTSSSPPRHRGSRSRTTFPSTRNLPGGIFRSPVLATASALGWTIPLLIAQWWLDRADANGGDGSRRTGRAGSRARPPGGTQAGRKVVRSRGPACGGTASTPARSSAGESRRCGGSGRCSRSRARSRGP